MVSNRTVSALLLVSVAFLGAFLAGAGPPSGPSGAATAPDDGPQTPADPSVTVAAAHLPAWISPNESLRISVTFTSDARSSLTRSVELRADTDGDGQLDRTLTERVTSLSRETQVVFRVPNGTLTPGEYRFGAVVDDEATMLGSTDVLQPPTFTVEELASNLSAVAGRTTNATVTVANEGDYGGTSTIEFRVDSDGDGSFDVTAAERTVTLAAGNRTRLRVPLSTASLDPGDYTYRVTTAADAGSGTLQLLSPPSFEVTPRNSSLSVRRGTPTTIAAVVRNVGDVGDEVPVTLVAPDGRNWTKSVTVTGNGTAPVRFNVSTADVARGNYTYTLSLPNEDSQVDIRVRDAVFEVSKLRGNETLTVGDPMIFAANVSNVGDATGVATVDFRIDLDDDDVPEKNNITTTVTLAPGAETTVRFRIPYLEDPDPLNQVEDLPAGAYIYGIYTADSSETSVFDARYESVSWSDVVWDGGGDDGTDGTNDGTDGTDGTDDGTTDEVSLDEISQDKYGLYYEELSAETQGQVAEIYERQPFAGDLGVTDVLTREEIARQKYGLDVERGDEFDFSAIDVDLQQQIEADFDAQFTSDAGDRIESFDELARKRYGEPFADLSDARQEEIRAAYWDQFRS